MGSQGRRRLAVCTAALFLTGCGLRHEITPIGPVPGTQAEVVFVASAAATVTVGALVFVEQGRISHVVGGAVPGAISSWIAIGAALGAAAVLIHSDVQEMEREHLRRVGWRP